MDTIKYAIAKKTEMTFDEANAKIREALKEQGFGILTEIDVKATLKKKLDKDFRQYVILGACNPPFAHQALSGELSIGLLLPCNVIVYETNDGKAQVQALNPKEAFSLVENKELTSIADQIYDKLKAAVESL